MSAIRDISDSFAKTDATEVDESIYHVAFVIQTCQSLVSQGLLETNLIVDGVAIGELVRIGEAKGYRKPTSSEIQAIMRAINNSREEQP